MCHLRYAEIRDGSLVLYQYSDNEKECVSKIPLYNLNIGLNSPNDKQYSNRISLYRFGFLEPEVTFQVGVDILFEYSFFFWYVAFINN